jgi:hypothetical protein
MLLGGLVAAFLAVPAERRSLEDIAAPLSMVRRALEHPAASHVTA